MREIEVRRMLDFRYWYWQTNAWGLSPSGTNIADTFSNVCASYDNVPFVIDPLGYLSYSGNSQIYFGNNTTPSTYLPRRTLRTAPLSPSTVPSGILLPVASPIFFWNDDLPFGAAPNSTARPSLESSTSKGDYSWFFTVMPVGTELSLPVANRRMFNVSVVVCYKRNLLSDSVGTLNGEQTANITANTTAAINGFPGMGIGGGTIKLDAGSNVNVKENQWVMLYHLDSTYPQLNRCQWYRVVGVGKDSSGTPLLSLVGADWDPTLPATLVVVPGAIGVYTTTMELDWDPLWTK